MYKFNEFVPANEIWPNAKAPEYKGVKEGLCTGWCVEVTTWKGETYWRSCTFGWESPEEIFNDDFWTWHWGDAGETPTGRISFRGYYHEEYDIDERNYYYVECDENGNILKGE